VYTCEEGSISRAQILQMCIDLFSSFEFEQLFLLMLNVLNLTELLHIGCRS